MELEEFSKYLNEEVIKNYSDIIFGQDIAKIYSVMVEINNSIPQLMIINKKNQLSLLKNNILYSVASKINGDLEKDEVFRKTKYILKTQYKCLKTLKNESIDASLEKTAHIYLYLYILIMISNESIEYCEKTLKQKELEYKGIYYIPNNGIDIDENKNMVEKVSRCVKKIKSLY